MRRRIVDSPDEKGIVLAPDLPTLAALIGPNPIPPSTPLPLIPNGTKGIMLDRKFFLNGKFVEPYALSAFEMQKRGGIEVEFFAVTEGPNRGLRGWVQESLLHLNARFFI
jgi:hypothetical protein